jgi:hypothetical protein
MELQHTPRLASQLDIISKYKVSNDLKGLAQVSDCGKRSMMPVPL